MRLTKNPLIKAGSHFLLWDILVDRRTRPLALWAAALVSFGTVIFHYLEEWSFVDSFYFSIVSLTTVGYGDLSPTTTLSKLFVVFFILNGIGILFALLDLSAEVRRDRLRNRLEQRRAGHHADELQDGERISKEEQL